MANSLWNPNVRRRKFKRLINWLMFFWVLNIIFLILLIARD